MNLNYSCGDIAMSFLSDKVYEITLIKKLRWVKDSYGDEVVEQIKEREEKQRNLHIDIIKKREARNWSVSRFKAVYELFKKDLDFRIDCYLHDYKEKK